MHQSIIVPQEVSSETSKYFPTLIVNKAQSLLGRAQISISFQKGTPDRFFIVSGIINDGNTYTSKVTYRKKEEETNTFVVSTTCDCPVHTQKDHCEHSCALFTKYFINYTSQNNNKYTDSDVSSISAYGEGVHPRTYGHLITSPTKLDGARSNSTYSSLQYMLTNRKVINFPIPGKFTSKLQINFVRAGRLDEFKNYPNSEKNFTPIFSVIKDEEITKEVSILEALYLFDWTTGKVDQLPSDIIEYIKFFINEGPLQPLNILLQRSQKLFDHEQLQFSIDDLPLNEAKFEEVQFRFSINQGEKKNYLDLSIEAFNEKEHALRLPDAFKILTGDNGYLTSFRTKTDSYKFIRSLKESFEGEGNEFKKFIHSCSHKKQISEWIKHINEETYLYFSDPHHTDVYMMPTGKFKSMALAFIDCFSDMYSRFSKYDEDNKQALFQIAKNQLLVGVADLYHRMKPLGVQIYYNNSEVKTWSNNIRFERRKSNFDWFELDLVVGEKDLEVIKNTQLGENYILTENNLVLLDTKEKELLRFMKKYTSFESKNLGEMDDKAAKKFSLNFKRSRIFELFELKKFGITGALTDEEEVLCNNLLNLTEMPHFDLPERYVDIAREYQVTGYQWLRFLFENKFGACLADDMGLGKTLQTIMFIQSVIDSVDKILIVCPVSILINWQNEIAKFADFDVEVYYGGDRKLSNTKKVIITSYGVMKKESYTTFNDMNFDILVMDEVQHLKNIRSLGASAARNLSAGFRVCLTGTPVENDLSEFYNILDLSIPGIWGELGFIKTTSTKKSRLLARKTVRPFILRRTKDQVLKELPEKEENHVYLNFKDEEKENYLTALTQIRSKIGNIQQGRKYGEILKSLLQLRQLCLWQKKNNLISTKVEFLQEYLETILEEKHKAIVFSQFTTYLDIIENKVREQGWKYARIDGSQSFKKRAQEVDRFQEGDAEVFLISLKAGGVGLNLTAASYIFLMDPWWNPAVENQAIDRAHRIGQENKLTVYRPIIKDSVEEKVLVLQNTKKELFRDLMAEDEESYYNGKLTMTDFQELIG